MGEALPHGTPMAEADHMVAGSNYYHTRRKTYAMLM